MKSNSSPFPYTTIFSTEEIARPLEGRIEYLYNCQDWNKTNQNNINLSHKVKGETISFLFIDVNIDCEIHIFNNDIFFLQLLSNLS